MAKRKMVQINLVKNSISAYFAAIEIHNKPNISYRYETVTLLMLNAWELALKAYVKKYIKKRLICYPMGLSGVSYVVPGGIQSIDSGAFSGCERLSSVMIPESVTNIGDGTFYYCANLTKVNIPNGVTSIGFGTFYSCMSLSSVTIPDSVTTIGESAFYFCISLTNLTVPDSIMSIGDFAFEYCDKLTLTVGRNSYAREYALENDIPYTYPDASDWLNN